MFGVDDAFIWAPLGGAALGALTNKNKFKGALMGGVLGAGGAALPGLLGSTAAPAAAGITDGAATSFAPMNAADFMKSQIAESATAPAASVGDGLLSSGGFKSAVDSYVKPFGAAMSAGLVAKGLLSDQPPPMQSSPVMQPVGGSNALTQLATQNQQQKDNELAQATQARALRRQMYRGGM